MNATATEARTNAAGFPLVTCYRCKGDGTYSYNPHSGTICFGCGGTGYAVRRGKAAKAWGAYKADVEAAWRKAWAEVTPGEAVCPHPMKPRKVEAVESVRPGLNPGTLLVTFNSGSKMGVPAGSSVKVAKLDPATLPNPADYTKDL